MGAIIRCDPLDGRWQTIGQGRYRGVVPEQIEASANDWGPDQLTFNLKAVEAAALRPDLVPYTPVELEIDGLLVWAGRVRQRPSTERDHSVICEGWQYHLDDDAFQRAWVHTRLGDYRDQRTFLTSVLTVFHAGGTVNNDNGTIVLGWPNGAVVGANQAVGVTLDLGPDSVGKRVVMTWDSSNNDANLTCFARSSDVEDATNTGVANDYFTFAMNSGTSGVSRGNAATARRYVHIFLSKTVGGTYGADVFLRIKSIKVFRDTSYEFGDVSVLKADTVAKDARSFAPLLDQADTYVAPGTFAIPEFRTSDYQTPRDQIVAANAYENFWTKIGGENLRTLYFGVKPAVPSFVVGEWSGSDFADASISGDDIYTKVIVTGTGPDGANLVSTRTQTGTLYDRYFNTSGGPSANRTKVLPIRTAGTSNVYDRFGDLWLGDHKLAPFAGKLTATTGIRRWKGGATVPPHELLLYSGNIIHLAHRVNPDTGAWGRDGVMVGMRYSHDQRQVEIDIDDRRDHFEKILERYAVLVDQFTQ